MRGPRLAILAGVLLLAPGRRAAGEPRGSIGLDVLPSLLELSTRPGERIERTVTLTNPGAEPLSVAASVGDWSMSESGEIRFEAAGAEASSCASWIVVEPPRVEVSPRGQSTVRVSIQSPPEFSGTRWAVVFFELPEATSAVGELSSRVAARIGLTVYVTAEGTEKEDLQFRDASASSTPNGVRLRAVFENRGNTSVRVRLTWQLRTSEGAVVRTYKTSAVSLPGRSRESLLRVDSLLPTGTYRVIGMATWGKKRWQARECELIVPPRAKSTSATS